MSDTIPCIHDGEKKTLIIDYYVNQSAQRKKAVIHLNKSTVL